MEDRIDASIATWLRAQDCAAKDGVRDPASTAILVCGMKGMFEGVKAFAEANGVPEGRLAHQSGTPCRLQPGPRAHNRTERDLVLNRPIAFPSAERRPAICPCRTLPPSTTL